MSDTRAGPLPPGIVPPENKPTLLSNLTAKVVVGTVGLAGWVAAGIILIFRPDTTHGEAVFQAFNAVALMIAGYYFGSSDGSARKSETIHGILERSSTPPADAPAAPAYKMPPMSAPAT